MQVDSAKHIVKSKGVLGDEESEGNWFDIDTDLFTGFKVITTGLVSLKTLVSWHLVNLEKLCYNYFELNSI